MHKIISGLILFICLISFNQISFATFTKPSKGYKVGTECWPIAPDGQNQSFCGASRPKYKSVSTGEFCCYANGTNCKNMANSYASCTVTEVKNATCTGNSCTCNSGYHDDPNSGNPQLCVEDSTPCSKPAQSFGNVNRSCNCGPGSGLNSSDQCSDCASETDQRPANTYQVTTPDGCQSGGGCVYSGESICNTSQCNIYGGSRTGDSCNVEGDGSYTIVPSGGSG
ncbi:MAG: hypothetical protein WAX04_05175, partial [Oscillospiraceae bacterium]